MKGKEVKRSKENLNKQYRGASPHTIEEVYQMLYTNF